MHVRGAAEVVDIDVLGVFAVEELGEPLLSPLGVLGGEGGVPPVEEVELDGDDVAFADGFPAVVGAADVHEGVEAPGGAVTDETEDCSDVI